MTIRTGDRQLIKELNLALVMNVIRQRELISRVDISECTGLGRSTVTGIVNTLIKEGLVTEAGSAESPIGRKPVLLTMNERAYYAVGIKLGPKNLTVALVDLNGTVQHIEEVALNSARGAEDRVAAIRQCLQTVVSKQAVPMEKILGAGVVMPGVVDPSSGTAVDSYFLGWANVPIRDILERELDMPVYVDNDANAMALAETLHGAGHGAHDVLALTVGVGIGAGVIIGGKIHRGARFSAGELGHTCVDLDGPVCVCGRRGCLEAVAADAAIVRRARQEVDAGRSGLLKNLARGHVELITRELVVDAAHEGDPGAQAVLAESGRWLGLAVGNAVNLLSPARVVVGGEAVNQAGELILGPMREAMAAVIFPALPGVPAVQGILGRNAWVQGAAALVLDAAFQVPIHQHDTSSMAQRIGQS